MGQGYIVTFIPTTLKINSKARSKRINIYVIELILLSVYNVPATVVSIVGVATHLIVIKTPLS